MGPREAALNRAKDAADRDGKPIPLRLLPQQDHVLGLRARHLDVVERQAVAQHAAQDLLNLGKHFDFVLCARGDLSIVCAVELDDASHNKAGRRDRDAFLATACESAALPLLRVSAERTYAIEDVRSRLLAVLGAKAKGIPQAAAR